MAYDLITNIASIYFKDRIEEIEEYKSNASDIQNEQMFDLLHEAKDTITGKKYDFKSIFSYQDFRERIPVTDASGMLPYLKRLEKGETNLLWPGAAPKLLESFNGNKIPVSDQLIAESLNHGTYDLLALHIRKNPDSKIFGGYFLSVGDEGEQDFLRELSILIRKKELFFFSLLNLPKKDELALTPEDGFSKLIEEIGSDKISCFRGTPERLSTFLKYSQKALNPSLLAEAEVLLHKTVYTNSKLDTIISSFSLPVPVLSYYMSPEGFIGLQDDPEVNDYLLMLDLSIFYEFLPAGDTAETPVPLEDIEIGVDYKPVITNCSGLWRYKSDGPSLRFVNKTPYRFILV
jgi:hypothetical protein